MDFSGERAFELLKKLSYTRVSGSEEETKTAEALKKEVESAGIDCHIEEFPVQDGVVSEAKLFVLEPYQKEYEVTGYLRADSTDDEGLTLDLVYVENGHPILLKKAKGKAALINGRVGYKTYEKLQKAGVSAILSFSGSMMDKKEESDLDIRKLREALADDLGGNVLVNMRVRDAMEIVAKGASKVKIVLKSEKKELTSRNVCAEIKGTEYPDEIISFGAHYDSVYFSKGAYDNMTGSVTIMEIMRYFAEHPPKRTLKFNWFGSEEQGLLGSKAYTKAHEDELEKHLLMINLDMSGPILGSEHACIMGAESFKPYLDGMMNELGFPVHTTDDIYSSDSIPFSDKGVPAVNFIRESANGAGYIHDRRDDVENDFLSAAALEKTIAETLEFSKRVVNAEEFPIERKISDTIKEKIDRYLFRKKD